MSATPLERQRDDASGHDGPLFLKREDLLPYGGGNKVRRFLHWLERRPDCRHVCAFSDRGSHSFAVLARMRADPALALERLRLYERPVAANPYRDRLASGYEDEPDIDVVRASTLPLLLRWWASALQPSEATRRLGIGGRTPDADDAYAGVFDECVTQLEAAGATSGRVVHLLPVASGDMAHAILRCLEERGLSDQRVVGVLTGPRTSRAYIRLRYGLRRSIALHAAAPMDWSSYVDRAVACHAATGAWLDPVHAIHPWDLLQRRPVLFAGAAVVLWVTCMRGEDPRSMRTATGPSARSAKR